mgnify:CR=1 FL=1|jgi:hypothetical protein
MLGETAFTSMHIFTPKHGWANKYIWLDVEEYEYDDRIFSDHVKSGTIVFKKSTGTTEADVLGSTTALQFFSENFVQVLETNCADQFLKFQIKTTPDFKKKYYYIEPKFIVPTIRCESSLEKPDLKVYCRQNGIDPSNLLIISDELWYSYVDVSTVKDHQIFKPEGSDHFFIDNKIKQALEEIDLKNLKFKLNQRVKKFA